MEEMNFDTLTLFKNEAAKGEVESIKNSTIHLFITYLVYLLSI